MTILAGEFGEGDTVSVGTDKKGGLVFKKKQGAQENKTGKTKNG
jgi:hypothetical protein